MTEPTQTAASQVLPAALQVLLSTERSSQDRVAALQDLRDSLHDEAVVRALCELAKVERSIEVRRALLRAILGVDVTRLADRAPLIELLIRLCATEPEEDLRLAATRQLALLAPDSPEVEEVLAETLLHERSDAIHEAALVGLLRRPDKRPRTLDLLYVYAKSSPPIARPLLVQLFRQLPREASEAGLLSLLSPWEAQPLREAILTALEETPALSGGAAKALLAYARAEPTRELRLRAVQLVAGLRDTGPELPAAIFELLALSPDGAELLDALSEKLDANPAVLPKLAKLLVLPGPARLKRKLLALLEKAGQHEAIASALADPNPWVRASAIEIAARLFPQHPEPYEQALREALPREQVAALREQIVGAFRTAKRLSAASEKALIDQAAQETSPRLEEQLAEALPRIALTDETRGPLLKAWLRVLRDPFAGEAARRATSERLRSFAFRDEPLLVACLEELLLRAPDRDAARELDAQLRKLSPDMKGRVPLLRTLLLRFLGDYPAEPGPTWARDLHALAKDDADVRAFIPQLVALTGETWMLAAADAAEKKSALLPTVLELLGEGKTTEAMRRIDDAWNTRTLRKSDLLALLQRLFAGAPGEDGPLQTTLSIAAKAKLATPDLQDLCLKFLREQPRSQSAYAVQELLKQVAKNELGYGERVAAAFTQAAYTDFCRTGEDPSDAGKVPRTFNDWEYQGYRIAHDGWPIAELYFDLNLRAHMHALLAAPPDERVPAAQSIQYLILKHLWQHGEESAEELRALGALAAASTTPSQAPLRDRAYFLIWKRWKGYVKSLQGRAPPPDLARLAAGTCLFLWSVRQSFGSASLGKELKEKQPEPLPEMDVAAFEAGWAQDPALLAEVRGKQLAAMAEARAKELLQLATGLANKGKRDEAAVLLERLLGPFARTKLVQGKRAEIEAYAGKARG